MMIIAIDFDGTIVKHEFPAIGAPVPHAIRVMKKLQRYGHKLILYTMRSDIKNPDRTAKEGVQPEGGGNYLTGALGYCMSKGVIFWAANKNPEQHSWTHSPKPYANLYIDDAAFGCPTIVTTTTERPFVNWKMVEAQLIQDGELPL